MTLSDSQRQQIEQAILAGNKLEAYRIYRDACQCDLSTAKIEVTQIEAQLRVSQPQRYNQAENKPTSASHVRVSKGAIIAFVLFDFLIFAAIVWWFIFADNNKTGTTNNDKSQSMVQAIPSSIDSRSYQVALDNRQTFQSLYREKIDSSAYQRHKRKSRSRYDELDEEPGIKTARSRMAANRLPPSSHEIRDILVNTSQQPVIDGVMNENEWQSATQIDLGGEHNTTLYLISDGDWLFIACDARDELSKDGFDQLRVYLHAGLIPEMKNERIHLGRNSNVTTIRQTTFRWQGEPPDDEDERWKKYAISDWGIYRYTIGATQLNQNRQYEIAIHMAEAGLHRGIPFTLYAEVETDPLRNEQKKFKKRQYLGFLGDQKNPAWFNIN